MHDEELTIEGTVVVQEPSLERNYAELTIQSQERLFTIKSNTQLWGKFIQNTGFLEKVQRSPEDLFKIKNFRVDKNGGKTIYWLTKNTIVVDQKKRDKKLQFKQSINAEDTIDENKMINFSTGPSMSDEITMEKPKLSLKEISAFPVVDQPVQSQLYQIPSTNNKIALKRSFGNIRTIQRILNPLDENFLNLFDVKNVEDAKVYSRHGSSKIFFHSGDSLLGQVSDNKEYQKQYLLSSLGMIARKIALDQKYANVNGIQYQTEIIPKTINLLNEIKLCLRFLMIPVTDIIRFQNENVIVMYNKRRYQGKLCDTYAENTFFQVQGSQISVFEHFKQKGITIPLRDKLIECKLRKYVVYLPCSQCWQLRPLTDGIKNQSTRSLYYQDLLDNFLHKASEKFMITPCAYQRIVTVDCKPILTREKNEYVLYLQENVKSKQLGTFFKTVEQLEELFQKHPQNKIALVAIVGKQITGGTNSNKFFYIKVKLLGLKYGITTQCCLQDSLNNNLTFQIVLKKADSKIKPIKSLKQQTISIAIDVHHQIKGVSRIGVHVRVFGSNPRQFSIASALTEHQEFIQLSEYTKIFDDIFQQIEDISSNSQVIIYRDYFGAFKEKEIPLLKQLSFYTYFENVSFFLVSKRHSIVGFGQRRGGLMLESNIFLFFGKQGMRPALYEYIKGKGREFNQQQMVQYVSDETQIHFHYSESKLTISHMNADRVAYFAAMLDLNYYKQRTSFS